MRIYIDMDGVISDFQKAAEEGGFNKRPDLWIQIWSKELLLCQYARRRRRN